MIYSIIKDFVLPPGCLFLALLVGLLLVRRRPVLGKSIILASLATFYALSTPAVGSWLLASLEADYAVAPVSPYDVPADVRAGVGAIVVLSAGVRFVDPNRAIEQVNAMALERLLTGAALHRSTGLPVLVSGGTGKNNKNSNAELMRRTLNNAMNVQDVWLEENSTTTYENALFSADFLGKRGINKIFLVTQAWHMKRSQAVFQAAGLETVAVPTGFTTNGSYEIDDYLPSARALLNSYYGMHEKLGLIWYRMTKF